MSFIVITNKTKNDAESVKCREMGNYHYCKNTLADYLIALKLYNKAICFAPAQSEHFFKALINRSSVYSRIGMYDTCLDNINLIKKYGECPSRIVNMLKKSEVICKRNITEGKLRKFEPIEPKLNLPAYENDPTVAKCLEIVSNEIDEPHIVTNSDLKVGDIVWIPEPLYVVLPLEFQYERCENCGKENSQNLIPCATCTAAMFCGESCLKDAMNRFHKYECQVIDWCNAVFEVVPKLTLRILICGFSSFENIDQFLDFTTEELKKKSVNKNFLVHPNSERDKFEFMCSFLKVQSVFPLVTDANNIIHLLTCIFALNKMTSKKQTAEFKKSLTNIVHKLIPIVEMNAKTFKNISYAITGQRRKNIRMAAIYPISKFLKHSCIPNVFNSANCTRSIISIVRPIKAGEPLLLCFFTPFSQDDLINRQIKIPFSCHCLACTDNYPVMRLLPIGSFIFPAILYNNINSLHKFDRLDAQKQFHLTINTMQDNNREMPSQILEDLLLSYGVIMLIIYCDEICIALRANKHIVKNY